MTSFVVIAESDFEAAEGSPIRIAAMSDYDNKKLVDLLSICRARGINVDHVESKAEAVQLLMQADATENDSKWEKMKLLELLQICTDKGINVDDVETKQEAIELLRKHGGNAGIGAQTVQGTANEQKKKAESLAAAVTSSKSVRPDSQAPSTLEPRQSMRGRGGSLTRGRGGPRGRGRGDRGGAADRGRGRGDRGGRGAPAGGGGRGRPQEKPKGSVGHLSKAAIEAALAGTGEPSKKVFGGVRMMPKSAQTFGTMKPGMIPQPVDEDSGDPLCERCKEEPPVSMVTMDNGRQVKACRQCIQELRADHSLKVEGSEGSGVGTASGGDASKPNRVCERCNLEPPVAKVAIVETGQSFKVCGSCLAEMQEEAKRARGESSAADPEAAKMEALAAKARAGLEKTRSHVAQARAVDEAASAAYEQSLKEKKDSGTGGEDDLPPGWRQAKRPKDGRVYYYHVETKETSWKRPTQ